MISIWNLFHPSEPVSLIIFLKKYHDTLDNMVQKTMVYYVYVYVHCTVHMDGSFTNKCIFGYAGGVKYRYWSVKIQADLH